jgi:hypothetical protein
MPAALNPIGAVTPPLTGETEILSCAGFLAGRPDFADTVFLGVDFFAADFLVLVFFAVIFFVRKAMRQPLPNSVKYKKKPRKYRLYEA